MSQQAAQSAREILATMVITFRARPDALKAAAMLKVSQRLWAQNIITDEMFSGVVSAACDFLASIS